MSAVSNKDGAWYAPYEATGHPLIVAPLNP